MQSGETDIAACPTQTEAIQNSDIKAIKTSHEVYPSCDDLQSLEAGIDFLPDTLKALLEGLFFLESQSGFNWTSYNASNYRPRVLLPLLRLYKFHLLFSGVFSLLLLPVVFIKHRPGCCPEGNHIWLAMH